jgi:PAS domain S-box-containing protein
MNNLIENIPFGYAYHKLICDEEGNPIDYIFLDVNQTFENLTGLSAIKIIDKRITEVIPGIKKDSFNWIEFYGEVALHNKTKEFEQYSELLNKWYKVHVSSNEKMHFTTIFTDITQEYIIADLSKNLNEWDAETIDYNKITNCIKTISGAQYVVMNVFEKNGKDFTTVGAAGVSENVKNVASILGFEILNKKWPHDANKEEKTKNKKTTIFPSLHDLTKDVIPKGIVQIIEKTFRIAETVIVKTQKDNILIGDFTLVFHKNTHFKNQSLTESIADMVGSTIIRIRTELELHNQQQILANFFSINLDLLCIADTEGNFIKVNKEWEKILGYTSNELEKRKFLDFVHPEDIEATLQAISNLKNQNDVINFIKRYSCKNGGYRYIEWRSHPKDNLIYSSARDITTQIKFNESLKQRDVLLKDLSANIPGAIYQYQLFEDGRSCIPYASDNIWNIFEVIPDEVKTDATKVFSRIHADDYKIVMNSIMNSYKTLCLWEQEFRVILPLQGTIWLLGVATPKKQDDNSVIWHGHISNITQRKNSEKIRELTSKLLILLNQPFEIEKILQNVITAIQENLGIHGIGIRLKNNDDFTYVSTRGFSEDFITKEFSIKPYGICKKDSSQPKLECMCGFVTTGKIPKNHPQFTEYGSFFTPKNPTKLTTEIIENFDFKIRNTCIHSGYKSYALIPIKNNQTIIGLLHVASEIKGFFTKEIITNIEVFIPHIAEAIIRKNIEHEIILAKEFAEKANLSKSEFLANMSHEIRTPLNAIVGFSELITYTSLTEKQKEYIKVINLSSKTLLELINDILDISKIEAGKLDLEYEETNIFTLVEKTIDIVKVKLDDKEIEVLIRINPNIPEIIITDNLRLQQVLVNLLNNAAKFTEKGEIELTVDFSKSSEENKLNFTFSIRDTGIGIPLDKQTKIFESFTQADNSTTRNYGGTGLGLSISSNIIQKMGSKIELSSIEFEGSTFSFTLCAEFKNTEIKLLENISKIKKALIIDDNYNSRNIIKTILESQKIKCDETIDGYTALKILESNTYDVIILDYNMPYLNGLQVIENLKHNTTPILLMHGSKYSENPNLGNNNLGFTIINKPVKHTILLETLSNMFGETSQEEISISQINTNKTNQREYSILIVDDNKFNLMLAATIVSENLPSAIITRAINGEDAIQYYEKHNFDLILMDIQMPIMNGYEATKKIREIEKNTKKHVPIIAITAGTISGEKEHCLEIGMDDFVPKPIEVDYLKILFDKYLEHTKENNETITESNKSLEIVSFDMKMAVEKYKNIGFIKELISLAKESIESSILELHKAAKEENIEQLKFHIHTIKGVSRGIYFNVLFELCRSIENENFTKPKKFITFVLAIEKEFDNILKEITK